MLSVTYPQGLRVVMPYLWPLAMLALASVTAVSSIRLVAAPGFEFYFGPLFYLLAFRWFGLRAGLVTALATALPSLWGSGSSYTILLAAAHVLAVHKFSGQDRSLAAVTFFFQCGIGALTGLGWLVLPSIVPTDVLLDMAVRRILSETLLAACADLILLALLVDTARGKVRRVRDLGLQQSLEALVSIAVAGAATLFLLGELNHVNERLDLHQQDVAAAIKGLPHRERVQPEKRYMLRMHGVETPMPFITTEADRLWHAGTTLGCRSFDAGQPVAGQRQSLRYWLDMCYVVPLANGQVVLLSPHGHVVALYRETLRGVIPLMAYLMLAQIGLLLFGRSVRRSSRVLNQALQSFGRSYVTTRPTAPFREADQLLGSFIAANNEFVAFERQKAHLMRTVEELRSAIDLRLLSDIRFDSACGDLRFARIDPAVGRKSGSLAIHPADVPHFGTLAGQGEIMVEFRRGCDQDDQWYLLIARDYDRATASWRYGCLIRLRTAKAFQTQMRHSARLMELGGMASALSHELRQPLFTISLAAENGLLLLQDGQPDLGRMAGKFERIVEQVERANAIVQRTSAYARTERDERVAMDLAQAVQNAARFMRPVMTERDIDMQVIIPSTLPILSLPRIGIEQIIVNALQNAADSIDTRRETGACGIMGVIKVDIQQDADAVLLTVCDNGAGLDPGIRNNAFNAFCTTKPEGKGTGLGLFVCRQIMDEVGGSIAIADNADSVGATLTLRFPVSEDA